MFDCAHTKGRVCYSSSQYEDWRPDAKKFPKDALKGPLDNWKGERLVDWVKVKPIMLARMDKAKGKGCKAIDWDNVDRSPVAYFQWLSVETRKRGMQVGLKNYPEKAKSLASYADFHVAEECTKYKECARYPSNTFFIEYMAPNKDVCKQRPYTLFADLALKKFKFCSP